LSCFSAWTALIGDTSRKGKLRTLRSAVERFGSTRRVTFHDFSGLGRSARLCTSLKNLRVEDPLFVAQDRLAPDQDSHFHPRGDFAPYRTLFSDIPELGISDSIPLTEYFPFRARTPASASAKRFVTHFCSVCSLQGLNNESRIKSARAAAHHRWGYTSPAGE